MNRRISCGVDFGNFLDSLVPTLISSYGVDADRIALSIDADDILLPINAAIPCGLIVNELISNALKHAFPNGRDGEDQGRSRSRDGGGRAHAGRQRRWRRNSRRSSTWRRSTTLGLQLVTLLTDQLGGSSISTARTRPVSPSTSRFDAERPIMTATAHPGRRGRAHLALQPPQRLKKLGYERAGRRRPRARRRCARSSEPPDIVLMDIHIEGADRRHRDCGRDTRRNCRFRSSI